MRRQDKHILGTALTLAGLGVFIDICRQNIEHKQKGSKLNWETFNFSRTIKWAALGGITGGIIGNEIYKSKFQKECSESFSSDRFIKDILKDENVKSNPVKYKAVKAIKNEVRNDLHNAFSSDLVTFPEDIGSLRKGTALNSTYDGDIVLAFRKSNSLGSLSNMSTTMHETIENIYSEKATVTKRKKATTILFDNLPTPVSIDVVYGRETGNYTEDKKLNLYVRPNNFWQSGTHFKTDIGIQKNILVNKPKEREVVKVLKLYFKKNGLPVESVLLDQLVSEAMSHKNYGAEFSVTENLLNSMDYITRKMNTTVIKDYANSNNNLLQKIDSSTKATITGLLISDLKKIELDPNYIREVFHL